MENLYSLLSRNMRREVVQDNFLNGAESRARLDLNLLCREKGRESRLEEEEPEL